MADQEALPSIIDFSENIADQEAPEPLPEREFPATITEVVVKLSQNNNRYAAVKFKINPDDYPADYPIENAPDGTLLSFNRVVLEDNPPARYRLRKFSEAIGAGMSKRIDTGGWIGLTAKITLKHDEYEGIKRANVFKVEAL